MDSKRLWGKTLKFGTPTDYQLRELAFGPIRWPMRHLLAVLSDDLIIEGSDDDRTWEPVSRWLIDERRRGAGLTGSGAREGTSSEGRVKYAWLMDEVGDAIESAPGEVGLDQLTYHIHKHKAILNKALLVEVLEAFGWANLTEDDLREPLKRGARRLRDGKRCYLCRPSN